MPPDGESAQPWPARLRRLVRMLAERDLDALLVTNPVDVAYLTGFLGGDSYLLAPHRGKPTMISDFRYEEELEPVKPLARMYMRKKGLDEAVADVIGPGVSRLGLQGEHVTLNQRRTWARLIGARRLIATSGIIRGMRIRKDAHELGLIRKAISIQQRALEAVLPEIRPGMTELEIAARLEAEMKAAGSRQPGFNTIAAAGANGSLPHYSPGSAQVRRDQPVLIDWGAVWRAYHGDMTRTFAVGRWPRRIRELYEIVLDAHLAAAALLAPGVRARDVDSAARDYIAQHGYGAAFGHGLGHGMGLDGHEEPFLSPMVPDSELEEGMVVTIEPGIYLPGIGGVRIEDDFVITARGAENLCTMPKTLEWSTLG